MKKQLFLVATFAILTSSIVNPLAALDFEKFRARPLPFPDPIAGINDDEFLYAIRAIVPDRYFCVGHKSVAEGGGYWGAEGQCGVQAAKDSLDLLRAAVSYFKCTGADGNEIDYSFEHNSFYKADDPSSAKTAPIVLAKTNEIRCETDPSTFSTGVIESKASTWKRECAEKNCLAVYRGKGRYFLIMKKMMTLPSATDPDAMD